MCHGDKSGAEEWRPSGGGSWRQLLSLSGAQRGLDSARPGPRTQFKSLFVKPLSVILYLEDLGGKGSPSPGVFPQMQEGPQIRAGGYLASRPQALEAGPSLFFFLFHHSIPQ